MLTAQEKAQLALWSKGHLSFLLEPHQREMKDLANDPRVELFYGDLTRRGGKTFTFVTDAIEYCIKNPGQRVRYATAFLSDLMEFIQPTFEAVLETCPEQLRPKYVAFRKTYVFPNGAEIKLVGLDKNPNGLRGNNIFRIYLDECGFIANLEYVHKSVIVPASARRAKQKKRPIKVICFSTPPEDATEHYAHQLKLKAQLEPNGAYFKRTLDEIDSIDDEEKERLIRESGGRQSVTVRREFFCEWVSDEERAVCPTFDEERHVRDFEIEHWDTNQLHYNWLFSADIGGVRDLTHGLVGFYDHDTGKKYVWAETTHKPHIPSSEIVKGFRSLLEGFHNHPQKVMDGAGIARVDFAKDHQFDTALPVKDEFHAGLLLLRNEFFKDNVVIHPSCTQLIATLKGGLLNKQRSDYARSDTLGHCDAVANLIYFLRMVDTVTDNRAKPKREDMFYGQELAYEYRRKKGIAGLGWRGGR